MVKQIQVRVEGICTTVVISDEPEALLAAKAAGRAIIGVEEHGGEEWNGQERAKSTDGSLCAPYIAPGWEYATVELAELAARRFLGLPWIIGETKRLLIRELRAEDVDLVPEEEELSAEEELFRDREKLAAYVKAQYGFYEYGTWAVVRRMDGQLVGLAGVSQPRLPGALACCLEESAVSGRFLELGYRIFAPYRSRGYAAEACREILEYTREVLDCRVCALIAEQNKASRRVAESLGMELVPGQENIRGTDSGSCGRLLLYAQNWPEPQDKPAPS